MHPTASWQRHRSPRRVRPTRTHLTVELLEARNLLDGGLANVLVNDPTADHPWVSTYPDGTQQVWPADTQSETAIALAGNRIVVAYNDDNHWRPAEFSPPVEETHFIGYAVSEDGGKTFQDKGSLPADPVYADYSDPVLAHSNRTGTTFLVTLTGNNIARVVGERLNVYRSVNNGDTFLKPVDGSPGFTAVVDQQDKPWVAVDNVPGPEGSGYGNVYLAWRDFSLNKANDGYRLTRSTDDGVTWGPQGGVLVAPPGAETQPGPPSANGAFITIGLDHAVYVFYWDKNFLMRKSTDQGLTFGPPITVANLRRQSWDLGIDGFGVDPFFQAAVNPVNGQLYAVYHDNGPGKDKADVFFRQSNDGGSTWSPAVRLNDDPTINDQWFPTLAVTPDGAHVGVFWYDRRLDPGNHLIDRFGVIGAVSGSTVTFGPNFRVTDVSFPPVFGQDAIVRSDYMGDYDQAVADNKFFYTTWGDNRLANPNYPAHVNQPDVRFAKIPVSGPAAALTAAGTLTASPSTPLLTPALIQPMLTGTLARWAGGAVGTLALLGIDVRLADRGGSTFGHTSGSTLWLDADATGTAGTGSGGGIFNEGAISLDALNDVLGNTADLFDECFGCP